MANSGEYKNGEIAKYVGMDAGEITRWTKRWVEPTFITSKTLNQYKSTNNKNPNKHPPNTPK